MKTLEEASIRIRDDHEFFDTNKDLVDQIAKTPELLCMLLTIGADSTTPFSMKLMMALTIGISIGMEMEK